MGLPRHAALLVVVLLVPLLVPWSAASRRLLLGQANTTHTTPVTSDPSVSGVYEDIGISYVVGVQLVAIPGTDNFLLMERPSSKHPDGHHYNAGILNAARHTFTNVVCKTSLENAGHSFLPDGSVVVLAGHKPQGGYPEGRKGIRVLNTTTNELQDVGQLTYGHWLATATQLPTGQIVVMSESPSPVSPPLKGAAVHNPFYEIWDPVKGSVRAVQLNTSFLKHTKSFYYPFNYVLPSGDLFVWSNTYGEIIRPQTGDTVKVLPTWTSIPKARKMHTAYPFGGSSVMLALTPEDNYQPEIMIFGGQWSDGWINTSAVNLSMRLRLTLDTTPTTLDTIPGTLDPTGYNRSNTLDTTTTVSYSSGQGWQLEEMPSPRVTFSSVMLPNGQVLLMGGAMNGLMGDAAKGGAAMANNPNLWPALYNPYAPLGQRYTTLAGTTIPRMLHSTAGLTTNGTVLVTGGDRSARFWSNHTYSACPTGFTEYRVEVFHPPFVFDTDHRPTITSHAPVMPYVELYIISYTMPDTAANVTSVVLVAPSSDTHTFNMHQRLIKLELLAINSDSNHRQGETVSVRGPPNANIAPPGMYMLFLLSGEVYGQAKWVTVV